MLHCVLHLVKSDYCMQVDKVTDLMTIDDVAQFLLEKGIPLNYCDKFKGD